MTSAWTWGDFPPAEIRLHRLHDVIVAAEGLVFLPGGELVPASITQHAPDEIAEARRSIEAAGGDLPVLTGPLVLCIKRGTGNYGHWLAEMLPAALLANRMLGPEVRFLVPEVPGALGAAIRDSLGLAGIGPDRVVSRGKAAYRVADLTMVHGLSLHGLYLSPHMVETLQDLAAPVIAAAPGCRLWVSRAGQNRCLWNEREVEAVLRTLGWRVVDPGQMPFPDQVALFKGAARVAGVMGAGLANLLFAPRGARVDVFAPAAMPDTFFWLIACLRGLDHRETRCLQPAVSLGPAPWDGGVVLSLTEILAALGEA
jgi:capsular polysaccharide biosynthesis protein